MQGRTEQRMEQRLEQRGDQLQHLLAGQVAWIDWSLGTEKMTSSGIKKGGVLAIDSQVDLSWREIWRQT